MLDIRLQIANEAHSAELAITISYPTLKREWNNCFIKNAQRIAIFELPDCSRSQCIHLRPSKGGSRVAMSHVSENPCRLVDSCEFHCRFFTLLCCCRIVSLSHFSAVMMSLVAVKMFLCRQYSGSCGLSLLPLGRFHTYHIILWSMVYELVYHGL